MLLPKSKGGLAKDQTKLISGRGPQTSPRRAVSFHHFDSQRVNSTVKVQIPHSPRD